MNNRKRAFSIKIWTGIQDCSQLVLVELLHTLVQDEVRAHLPAPVGPKTMHGKVASSTHLSFGVWFIELHGTHVDPATSSHNVLGHLCFKGFEIVILPSYCAASRCEM